MMQEIINPTETPDNYKSWFALWLDVQQLAEAGNIKFVIHDSNSLKTWTLDINHISRMALEEIVPKLPTPANRDLLQRHFDYQNLNRDGKEIERIYMDIPTRTASC